jgi:acetylornithine deacetylase/succinyl-diaminopimelate desuccinylase-like protein
VRTAPEQSLISIKRELLPIVRSFDPEDIRYQSEIEFYVTIPGYEISSDAEIVQTLQGAHKAVHGKPAIHDYSRPVNDAVHLLRYGIPTVIYGPGGVLRDDGKEETNEYVHTANLVNCAKVYALTALGVCNWPKSSDGGKVA